jgi:O-antigen ligase
LSRVDPKEESLTAEVSIGEVESVDRAAAPQSTRAASNRGRFLAYLNHPLHVIGYQFSLVYVFFVFCQLHQLLTMAVNVETHILIIVGAPMMLLVLLNGGLRRTVRWPVAKYWVGYSLWMVIAAPFSTWKGASLTATWNWLRVEVLILFVIAGCVITLGEVRRLMVVLAWAAAVDVLVGRVFSNKIADRLELTGTTMSNANDYAALLILVIPCLLLVVAITSRRTITRILAAGISLYGLYLILMTGSRGALAAICVIVLFCLWRLRPSQKVFAGLIIILAVFTAPIIVPQRILARLSTTLASSDYRENDSRTTEATESKQDRIYLLKQSILTTLSHPLFGVGIGQFQNYEGRTSREMGSHGHWHETHNSYTQASSEIGIPALLFFLAAIFSTYRMLDRVYRVARKLTPTRENQEIAATALCLLLSLVGFCTTSFFLSLAYRFYLPALTGVTIAFYRAVQQKWKVAAEPAEN